MWMYQIYWEIKTIYKIRKTYKEIKGVLNDLENMNWDEIIDQVNNNMNNVVSVQ